MTKVAATYFQLVTRQSPLWLNASCGILLKVGVLPNRIKRTMASASRTILVTTPANCNSTLSEKVQMSLPCAKNCNEAQLVWCSSLDGVQTHLYFCIFLSAMKLKCEACVGEVGHLGDTSYFSSTHKHTCSPVQRHLGHVSALDPFPAAPFQKLDRSGPSAQAASSSLHHFQQSTK